MQRWWTVHLTCPTGFKAPREQWSFFLPTPEHVATPHMADIKKTLPQNYISFITLSYFFLPPLREEEKERWVIKS